MLVEVAVRTSKSASPKRPMDQSTPAREEYPPDEEEREAEKADDYCRCPTCSTTPGGQK